MSKELPTAVKWVPCMGLRIEDFPPKGCSEELEKWNIVLGEFADRFKQITEKDLKRKSKDK